MHYKDNGFFLVTILYFMGVTTVFAQEKPLILTVGQKRKFDITFNPFPGRQTIVMVSGNELGEIMCNGCENKSYSRHVLAYHITGYHCEIFEDRHYKTIVTDNNGKPCCSDCSKPFQFKYQVAQHFNDKHLKGLIEYYKKKALLGSLERDRFAAACLVALSSEIL